MLTYLFMFISFALGLLLMLVRRSKYQFGNFSLGFVYLTVVVFGFVGAKITSFLEDGTWSGIRYYGTIFLVAVALYPVSKIAKVSYYQSMNYISLGEMLCLVIMKVNCIIHGCCSGKLLVFGRKMFPFPSQWIELIIGVAIIIVICFLERKKQTMKYIFPFVMMSYGITRGVFESLRSYQSIFFKISHVNISIGHLFCAAISFIGIIAWVYGRKHLKGIDIK